MVLFALGTQIVYSCKNKFQAIRSLPLENLPLLDKDIELIEELSNKILPLKSIESLQNHTTTPFVLTMANDCLSEGDRDKFIEGYGQFDDYVKVTSGKSLKDLSDQEFKEFVSIMENKTERNNPSPVHFFAGFVRDKNIQYLTSSEYFLTTYRDYQMAPGFYKGCVALS